MALILIVEDEAAISDLVAIHAKMAGHRPAAIRDGGEAVFVSGGLTVRLAERVATLNGREVDLTAREFELLRTLIDNKNIALSRGATP
jgi:two-component system response regulator PrrA